MSDLRRVALAIYSALALALCLGLVALAWDEGRQLDLDLGNFRLVSFIDAGTAAKWMFTVVLGLFAALAGLTFVLAAFPESRARRGTVQLKQPGGARIEVDTGTLETIVKEEVERLPDVRLAQARVRVEGNALETDLAMIVEHGANIAHVSAAAAHTAASALAGQTGEAEVRRPTVRVSYDSLAAIPIGAGPPPPPIAGSRLRFDTPDESRDD